MARNSIQNCCFGGPFRGPPRLWKFVKKAVSAFLPIPGSAHSEWGFPTSVTTKYAPIPGSTHSEWGFLTSGRAKGAYIWSKKRVFTWFSLSKGIASALGAPNGSQFTCFWVSVEFLRCLGCLFRHCLGLGSAKRLVIYVLWGNPFRKYFSERPFSGTASALEAPKGS